jgi:ADP-ribose pyrophosphatase YjhB (NUDIX family)
MTYVDPIDENELRALMADYGRAEVEHFRVEVDENLFDNRVARASDRRGEVVFAIELPSGILIHRKSFYGNGVFRLPSGGIDYGERVIDALRREIREETGLRSTDERLLGVQDCQLCLGERAVRFVSYVFHVRARGNPRIDPKERIVAVRVIPPAELADVAESLRHTPPPNDGWGRWRALAHDLAYRRLAGTDRPDEGRK